MWLFKFPMLKSFLSNQNSGTLHLSLNPYPWLFLPLCLLSPSMWWKAETFTSSYYCILTFFPTDSLILTCLPVCLPLQRHRGDVNAHLCSWLQCHADPWLPKGGIFVAELSEPQRAGASDNWCTQRRSLSKCEMCSSSNVWFSYMLWQHILGITVTSLNFIWLFRD